MNSSRSNNNSRRNNNNTNNQQQNRNYSDSIHNDNQAPENTQIQVPKKQQPKPDTQDYMNGKEESAAIDSRPKNKPQQQRAPKPQRSRPTNSQPDKQQPQNTQIKNSMPINKQLMHEQTNV